MKIAGMILLLLSGVGIAVMLSRETDMVLSRTRALLALLIYTRDSVEMYSLSGSEILQGFGIERLSDCGYPVDAPFPESFLALSERCVIPDDESNDAFLKFSQSFGQGYRQQELQRCGECIECLQKRENELALALPSKKKMIFGVSVCATLIVLILLL